MLSLWFHKDCKALKACQGNTNRQQTNTVHRHAQRQKADTQGEMHKTAHRQAQIQTHVREHGRHREHETANSNLDSLLVKCLWGKGFHFFLEDLFVLCMWVHCHRLQTHQKRESDPITNGCEPPCGCWELNSESLKEQSALLTTEPSLQPLPFLF